MAAPAPSEAGPAVPEEEWPALREDALHGLAGRVVRALAPWTEADPAGLLLDFLAAFGALTGPGPYIVADGARHPGRLFIVIVGKTSRGRKGTIRANVGRIFEHADPDFAKANVLSGLSTGEGLIAAVGDGTKDKRGDLVGVVQDKRLLVFEPEFARVLKVAARESATLSAILRDAWDRGNLQVATRKDPLRATGAHVCIIAHVTREELRRNLTETETANGLANRFLFGMVRRSRRLPEGGGLSEREVVALGGEVSRALSAARVLGRITRDADAARLWATIYELIEDDREGLYGAVTARAEAQILRLSLTFALIDGSKQITREHLLAALSVWEYSEASARTIFGTAFGDEVSERLFLAIQSAGETGMDVSAQFEVFGRHIKEGRLTTARAYLERRRLIVTTSSEGTRGRPRIVSRALPVNLGVTSSIFAPIWEGRGRGRENKNGAKEVEVKEGVSPTDSLSFPPSDPFPEGPEGIRDSLNLGDTADPCAEGAESRNGERDRGAP